MGSLQQGIRDGREAIRNTLAQRGQQFARAAQYTARDSQRQDLRGKSIAYSDAIVVLDAAWEQVPA